MALPGSPGAPSSTRWAGVRPRWRTREGVSLAIQDPDNPYRYVEIRGRVEGTTEEGADAHIDALARRYLGQDTYPFRQPGEQRIIYKIRPEHVSGM